MSVIVLILLVFLLFGGIPSTPWMAGRGMGWYPSGGFLILIVLVIVLLRPF